MSNSAFQQTGIVNASTVSAGGVEQATPAEVAAKTDVGGSGAPLFVVPSLIPDQIVPIAECISTGAMMGGTGNVFSVYSDVLAYITTSASTVYVMIEGCAPQSRLVTTDWAAADTPVLGAVIIGAYLYLGLWDSTGGEARVYRYAKDNLAAGGTLMTFSGQAIIHGATGRPYMSSNGTYFYFSYNGGNSANTYQFARYTLSGTTFTYVNTLSLGTSNVLALFAKSNEDFYTFTSSAGTIAKYDSAGVLQYTATSVINTPKHYNLKGNMYVQSTDTYEYSYFPIL